MRNRDFVYSADWEFVRNIDLPAFVLPGNDTPHPAVIGIEVADILQGAERLIDSKRPDYSGPHRNKVVEFLAHSMFRNPIQNL